MSRPATLVEAPAARAPMDGFYAALRVIARFWVWFFFRRVDVRHPERVPGAGPALLCVNHPNNLIDSLLIGVALPRQVHFLATASLFRNPLAARCLRAAGVIPIYRRQDDPDKMERNVEVLAACHRAFDEGRLIVIYPEGTTHAEARVQRLRTGAARLALGYEAARATAAPLRVIPVGLSFEARKAFGGRVLVSFGAPIALEPYLGQYGADAVGGVEALTDAIQAAMEAEVVHVDRIDAAAVVRGVEEVYRDALARELREARGLSERQIDFVRLGRTIVDAVQYFKAREPERVERIWQRIQGYRTLLAAYRVRDEQVRARLERRPRGRRLLGSGRAMVGLPVFAYGTLLNALPYLLPRWLARRVAKKETDYATARLLASVVAFPVFWGLEVAIVWRFGGGWWAVPFALSLPVSGLCAYHYLLGLGRLRRGLRFGVLALTQEHAARALVAERQALIGELDRAKADYLTATRGSSF